MTNIAPRQRLPDRRPNQTQAVRWAGSEFSVSISFRLDGRPGEVFVDDPKGGSDLRAILADACVLLSLGLQYGIEPGALAYSLARVPVSETETAPASIIGAIADALMQGSELPGSSDLGNDPAIELIGQEFDVGVSQSVSGRPCDARSPNRPDLRHQRRDAGRELPEANDSPSDERTHDVNDEMLAKEYRRGLRVRFGNRIRCDSLGFLFGE